MEELFVTLTEKEYDKLIETKEKYEEYLEDANKRAVGVKEPGFDRFPIQEKMIIQFTYKNWRNEISVRKVVVQRVHWGSTEYHQSPGFLLEGLDLDKMQPRVYSMQDIASLIVLAWL